MAEVIAAERRRFG